MICRSARSVRWHARVRHLLVAVLLTGIWALLLTGSWALTGMTTAAHAGSNTYCWGYWFSSGANCHGPRHSLRQNWALNYYGDSRFLVAAAAITTDGYQYGSWVYGWGSVCHSYSGQNLLYPWMYNPDSRGQRMGGVEYWGSEPACP